MDGAVTKRLTLIAGFSGQPLEKGVRRIQTRFSKLRGAAVRAGRAIGRALTTPLGMLGMGGGIYGLIRAFTGVTRAGINFEQTLTTVAGVMRATEAETIRLSMAARKMGEITEWTASQAGESLLFLGMAGFEVGKAIKALPGTLDLATAGNIDLGRAADIATNALTAMGLPVEELTRINDVFVGTITRSNVNMEMMAEAFKYAAPVARAYGYTVEELSGLIGMLGNAGIQGTMAGTQLAMAIQKTNEVAEKFGVPGGKFVDVLERLREKGIVSTDVMDEFGMRAGRAAGVLYDATDATKKFQEILGTTGGEAKRLADIMRSTIGGSFKELKSVVESLVLDVFDRYRDELKVAVVATIDWIRNNKEQMLVFADDIKAILADLGEGFVKFGEVLVTVREPLSFYPKDLSEIDGWLGKIKDKLAWFFDKMPQFYFFRKMIEPFRGEGWDEFLSDLEKANMWLGMIEKKLPLSDLSAPGFIGPRETLGPPKPTPPSPPPSPGGISVLQKQEFSELKARMPERQAINDEIIEGEIGRTEHQIGLIEDRMRAEDMELERFRQREASRHAILYIGQQRAAILLQKGMIGEMKMRNALGGAVVQATASMVGEVLRQRAKEWLALATAYLATGQFWMAARYGAGAAILEAGAGTLEQLATQATSGHGSGYGTEEIGGGAVGFGGGVGAGGGTIYGAQIRGEKMEIHISPVVSIVGDTVIVGSMGIEELKASIGQVSVEAIQDALDTGEINIAEVS